MLFIMFDLVMEVATDVRFVLLRSFFDIFVCSRRGDKRRWETKYNLIDEQNSVTNIE